MAGPFLKWAGGKKSLIKQYSAYLPLTGERYFEPFTGSAAIFFSVHDRFKFCSLSDSNAELVNCYLVVRDQLQALMHVLDLHQKAHRKEHYYVVREMDRGNLLGYTPVQRAARFIYLNKTCFNGLWRVNRNGYFNVPPGKNRNPKILDLETLEAASAALQGVEIVQRDFLALDEVARPDDVIYFDPPYDPLTKTSSFTAYSSQPFGENEQTALAALYRKLDARGCILLLSNSDTPLVRSLYEGFYLVTIEARRAINADGDGRGPISELLIVNHPEANPAGQRRVNKMKR